MSQNAHDFLSTAAALEAIAAVEHERWSHWQRYLHDQCSTLDDGSLQIPAHLVSQWEQQIVTPYAKLSEKEKDSDREQAVEYIASLKRAARNTA